MTIDTIQANGTLQNSLPTAWVDHLYEFFAGLAIGGHTPAVWSRKDGRVQTLDRIRVGNRIDTIRSRRNAKVETYIERTFVP